MDCRVCDSQNLELVVDLGEQPRCNNFLKPEDVGKEPFYPLRLLYCHDCHTSQLDFTVKKEVMYSDHTYLSGVTKSLSEHFLGIAQEVDNRFMRGRADKRVLDIGSNDGTQLKHFQALGYEVLGVEPSKTTARIANKAGVPTLNAFFNEETMKGIGKQFDVFNAAGVFFHLEELHSVCRAIKQGLKQDGIFVVQFLYMKSIMENSAFDQIYHEHLLYYTLETIEVLLNRHGLSMFDAYLAPIHGGSIIGFISHEGTREPEPRLLTMREEEKASGCNSVAAYRKFDRRIKQMKEENLAYLRAAKAADKKVYGFGAPIKGNTMLNYLGVGPDLIQYLVEKNELRRGLYSPGMHIPLLIEDEVKELPDIYYVLAWNFKKEILANNKALMDQGVEFYFPVNPKVCA
ncbi:class I SAM-dependent methyltransferase [Candidatus Thiosymbion oneisti]|uniref:class I SAM-dependent methyltransferase n=1 Tax=Candidatus Thiosymbion oneisti TaxID=589554 RepID=UPI000B7EBCAC|nr:class I SAM-dependent methyltransferase [Candidatus Thiosymbion oneisti]